MTTKRAQEGEHIGETGEVWEEFMNSEFAEEALTEEGLVEEAASKKTVRKAAYEQFLAEETGGPNKLGEGPVQDEVAIAHPGGGTTTEGVSGVSSERSQGDGFSPQYEMQPAAVPATGDGAQVETIVEQQDKDMQSATSQPTGMPNANKGEPGGLKWASQVRGYLKKVEALLDQAENGKEASAAPEVKEAQTREAILRMTKLADELDSQGLVEEVAELDQLIEAEVAVLEGTKPEGTKPEETTEVTAQVQPATEEVAEEEEFDEDDLNALVQEIMTEELETA